MRPDPATIGRRIAALREQRGWSIDRLAFECARAGAPALYTAALRQIEAGRRTADDGELAALAQVFGESLTAAEPSDSVRPPRPAASGPVDFFISYSLSDDKWATWIAHELESAGYRVMIQAWDFVPGTNFLDFIDRGIREAAAVIAVLSRAYLTSHYGRLEWMAALRADGGRSTNKLVPVRVEDIALDGLLASITFVDLVGLADPAEARGRLLERIRHARDGRAKPTAEPVYPGPIGGPTTTEQAVFPPSVREPAGRSAELVVLHVAAPRFGATGTDEPVKRLDRLRGGLARLTPAHLPAPELLIVSGSLTESGTRAQFEQAFAFVTGLRTVLGLEANRVVVVPGSGDITGPACEAYFADCLADGIEPRSPYFRKWRHFSRLFGQLYPGIDGPTFDADQPWTLFHDPDLRIAVAGLNSTVTHTHLSGGAPGVLGREQLDWFTRSLAQFEQNGHLRIGVVAHAPVPGSAPTSLADAADLDQALGARLNVLLSGSPDMADGEFPSGLTVVPPSPSGAQLLHVTRAGLAAWPVPGSDDDAATIRPAVRLVRDWHTVDSTFAPAVDAGPRDVAPDQPMDTRRSGSEVGSPQDPVSLLLQRIAEVCEVRHPGARIRWLPGRPASLLVTYADGDAVPQFRVAAHVGPVGRDDVAAFVRMLRGSGTDLDAELVYQGLHPGTTLLEEAQRDGVRLRSFVEFQGLLDLRGYVAAQTERLRADPIYPPELYVPQRFRETVQANAAVRDDVVGEMLRLIAADDGRFVLLMGDFGRGKTFALHRLAMEVAAQLPDVAPILIELRTLDKAHSVDGLVAAHLANHGESRIDLRAFRYLLRQGRVVLLFDGFDELATRVSYDRAADHLDTLLAAADGRAKIVLTSRTQHFQSDAQVRTALGERVGLLPQRRILQLEDFSPAQINRYLVNRYGQNQKGAEERLELIDRIEDLGGLSRNPRMLGFVADLEAEQLVRVATARGTMSAAGLYREILTAWLTFEHRRTSDMPGSYTGLSVDELWHAVTTLALRMWESNEMLLRLDDVAEVAKALTGLAETPLSPPQATHAVGAGSLLVRAEEMFGFIHSSVMEWLVANEIARQLNVGERPVLLGRRQLSQLAVDFLCDLADAVPLQEWAARPDGDDIANANALRISSRLRSPAIADLRGAVLRGHDFSHRDLSGADLTGADLTGARLIGTKLSRAVLRDVKLHRARLDRANLRDADLTGADLTAARLPEADLRGVQVAGSQWARATLINVVADPELWSAPELRGAARAPGQPVLTGLQPAAVGVPFGFEPGKLPRPLAYSRGGSLLAIGSDDGGVLLCDTHNGQPIRTLNGHLDRVYAVAYGPSDGALVTASADGTVRCWDPVTGDAGAGFTDHVAPVWPLVLDRTGRLAAYGDGGGTVWVRRLPDGDVYRELAGHAERVWALAFHPDPTTALLASADNAGTVRIWYLAAGAETHRLAVPNGSAVYTLAFSPDGRRLATGGRDGLLRIWDVATGDCLVELTQHTAHVYVVAFHPDGGLLASGDTNGSIWLWRLSADGTAVTSQQQLPHDRSAAVYTLEFSPDGDWLAGGDSDGSLRIWDGRTGQLRHETQAHRGAVWPLVFRPDSGQIATTGKDGTVRLWKPETGQQRHELHGHGRRITRVQFDPTGELLVTSGNDGVVRLWDPRTGRLVESLTGRADQLVSAVFCPAEPILATTSNDGGVYMWQMRTWTSGRELDVGTEHVWASAFDPAGDLLATANDDDTVRLWSRWTGNETLTLHEHRGRVRSITFSPDGRIVATGCDDGKVRMFDRDTGECRATLVAHHDRVYDVRFRGDGSVLASVSNDGTAVLWDVSTGEQVRVLRSQRGRLWSGGFSPDGRLFAAAGDDAVICLWDAATGAPLHTLPGHTRRIWSIDFSPDGQLLASGADDGTTRLWDLTDPDRPRPRLTLLGLPDAWAAVTPDGRYKTEGTLAGEFWHVIGLCRFEVGELDPFLRDVHSVPIEDGF